MLMPLIEQVPGNAPAQAAADAKYHDRGELRILPYGYAKTPIRVHARHLELPLHRGGRHPSHIEKRFEEEQKRHEGAP